MSGYNSIQGYDQNRIKTNMEELVGKVKKFAANRWEGRIPLISKAFWKEAGNYLVSVILPNGADEIGNCLYSGTGSGYWAGQGRGNAKIEPLKSPEPEAEPPQQLTFIPTGDDRPVSFDYTPPPPDHAGLYGAGQTAGQQPSSPDDRPISFNPDPPDHFDDHSALYGTRHSNQQGNDMEP